MAEEVKRKRGNPSFSKGMKALNPNGRPKGSLNKYTILSRELLSSRGEEIVQVIIDRALRGDVHCLKMCIDRIIPLQQLRGSHNGEDSSKIVINVGTQSQITSSAEKVVSEGKVIENPSYKSEEQVVQSIKIHEERSSD